MPNRFVYRFWLAASLAACLGSIPSTASAADQPFVLPFQDPAYRNWSEQADTIYLTLDASDFTAKRASASKLWLVLSARSLLPEFWTDPTYGAPRFTQRCVVKKAYDFRWIEATEVPVALKGNQLKVQNAKGAYYAFMLAQMPDGSLTNIKVVKLGDATRNPPQPNAFGVKNGQVLERTWDDDKRSVCK